MQPSVGDLGGGPFLLDHNMLNPIYLSFVWHCDRPAVVEPEPGLKARLERLEYEPLLPEGQDQAGR